MKLEETFRKNKTFDEEDQFNSGVQYKTMNKNFCPPKNKDLDLKRNEMDKSNCGFRLDISSTKSIDDGTVSVSSYSTSKQRIDAMFDDSRSILSDCSKRLSCRSHKNINLSLSKKPHVTNNIEERIKKMFEEISISDWRDNEDFTAVKASSEESTKTFNSTEKQMFSVTYLGSKPLHEKSINLKSIQDPLKDLYFNYKKNTCNDDDNYLTIAKEGLKIKFQDKEELHTFNTIAVWASVKLSFRRTFNTMEFAFVPIVIDPEGIDKNSLFKELKNEDKYERLKNFQIQHEGTHYPIFAVVMKNLNKNKELECHGFICKSSEEAIIIAANLYGALVEKIKKKKEQKIVNGDKKKEKEFCENDGVKPVETKISDNLKQIKKEAVENPKQPPKMTDDIISDANYGTNLNSLCTATICKNEFPTRLNGGQKPNREKLNSTENANKTSERRGSAPENIYGLETKNSGKSLRRTVSDKGGDVTVNDHFRDGDVLTKVTIPRSSSFLNANGLLSRFPRCQASNAKNHSPLGFKELFNEFQQHEGLENMDDILNVIIDAEGMSFNELKPIYKEFLLKLALTLTKDELYQRSKLIMRRQKKRSKNSTFKKTKFMSNLGIEKIFKNSLVNKSKTRKKSKSTDLEFTSVVFNSSKKQFLPNLSNSKLQPYRTKRNQKLRKKLTKRLSKHNKKQRKVPSRANNFLQRFCHKDKKSATCFSCSGSTFNSENCTCSSVGTCSCMLDSQHFDKSLKQYSVRSLQRIEPSGNRQVDDSVKTCSCDTESCTDSGKCYCPNKDNRNPRDYGPLTKNIGNTSNYHVTDSAPSGSFTGLHKKSSVVHTNSSLSTAKEEVFSWSKSNLLHPSNSFCVSKTHNALTDLIYSHNKSKHQVEDKIHPYSRKCSDTEEHELKEIQNTMNVYDFQDPKLKTQNTWAADDRVKRLLQTMDYYPSSFLKSGATRHSSLRCKNEPLPYLTNTHGSCNTAVLGSLRHRNDCEHKLHSHTRHLYAHSNLCNSSLRFTRRMDVYNSYSEKNLHDIRRFCDNQSAEIFGPKCDVHDYNFSVDNWRGESEDRTRYSQKKNKNFCGATSDNMDSPFQINKKKVLVVSARDSKGKVLYMGTSNKCETPVKNSNNCTESNVKAENEALAIKKSAEIAALFSEISNKSKLSYFNSLKEQNKNIHWSLSNSFKDSNLENTLGYFP